MPTYFINSHITMPSLTTLRSSVFLFQSFCFPSLQCLTDAQKEEGHCVWYGVCKDNTYNCPYSGQAKPLKEKAAIKILGDLCPQYATSKYREDGEADLVETSHYL
jgi:hypothetical protein